MVNAILLALLPRAEEQKIRVETRIELPELLIAAPADRKGLAGVRKHLCAPDLRDMVQIDQIAVMTAAEAPLLQGLL